MILLTDELREPLLANGRDPGADHVPVVKFFNPLGEGVWLATELRRRGGALTRSAPSRRPSSASVRASERAPAPRVKRSPNGR